MGMTPFLPVQVTRPMTLNDSAARLRWVLLRDAMLAGWKGSSQRMNFGDRMLLNRGVHSNVGNSFVNLLTCSLSRLSKPGTESSHQPFAPVTKYFEASHAPTDTSMPRHRIPVLSVFALLRCAHVRCVLFIVFGQ